MASQYFQEYFFQHILINGSFRNINDIIHPNAGNITEYIRNYASAAFVNGSSWNGKSRILNEIQFQGNHNNYINSYMNFVDVQRTAYNLVTKGTFL